MTSFTRISLLQVQQSARDASYVPTGGWNLKAGLSPANTPSSASAASCVFPKIRLHISANEIESRSVIDFLLCYRSACRLTGTSFLSVSQVPSHNSTDKSCRTHLLDRPVIRHRVKIREKSGVSIRLYSGADLEGKMYDTRRSQWQHRGEPRSTGGSYSVQISVFIHCVPSSRAATPRSRRKVAGIGRLCRISDADESFALSS